MSTESLRTDGLFLHAKFAGKICISQRACPGFYQVKALHGF